MPATQPPNLNQYDSPDVTLSSDALQSHRVGAKHTIPGEPQPELKRGKHQSSTNCSLHKTPPSLQESTGRAAISVISKDDTSKLVQQGIEEMRLTGSEFNYRNQYPQHRPELANRSLYTDTMISSFPDPQGYEEISSVRIIEMLALLRLNGTFSNVLGSV
jgi:hypothetical protein